MFNFIAGLVLGAAFAPFWMMVWSWIKARVTEYLSKKSA